VKSFFFFFCDFFFLDVCSYTFSADAFSAGAILYELMSLFEFFIPPFHPISPLFLPPVSYISLSLPCLSPVCVFSAETGGHEEGACEATRAHRFLTWLFEGVYFSCTGTPLTNVRMCVCVYA
jgi:hypothetical protein